MTKLIGTAPNQTPTNADLGKLAYQDSVETGLDLPSSTTANQYLTVNSAGNGYEWIDRPSIYLPTPILPSNFGSPTNTYSSSGTWSKGSTAGSTGVWMYLLGGGGGGGNRSHTGNGGNGGSASLIYLTADQWDGATYTIGTGGAGGANGSQSGSAGTATSITLSSANGSTAYTSNGTISHPIPTSFAGSVVSSQGVTITVPSWSSYSISTDLAAAGQTGTPAGAFMTAYGGDHGDVNGHHSVLGGGGGAGHAQGYNGSPLGNFGTSIYAGNGAKNANGVYPGGGASAKTGGGTGYVGAAGNLRVYHV